MSNPSINLSSGSADDRNNLEKLTLAVLSHLPTAVLFVHDLSGECGTSPSDQVSLDLIVISKFNTIPQIEIILVVGELNYMVWSSEIQAFELIDDGICFNQLSYVQVGSGI